MFFQKRSAISLAIAATITFSNTVSSQETAIESTNVQSESFFDDSTASTNINKSFNDLITEVGFHKAIRKINLIANKSGETALLETAQIRNNKKSHSEQQTVLLETYGEAIDRLATSEQATFDEMAVMLEEYGIQAETRNNLVSDKNTSMMAIAFSKAEEGKPDILVAEQAANDSETARALLIAEIGELASARIFKSSEGDFGSTLLTVLYDRYNDLHPTDKLILAHKDDITVDGRTGQTTETNLESSLNAMDSALDEILLDVTKLSGSGFVTDNIATSIVNFNLYAKNLGSASTQIAGNIEKLNASYKIYKQDLQEARDFHKQNNNSFPDFSRGGSFLGVGHSKWQNVNDGLEKWEKDMGSLSDKLPENLLIMATAVVENIGKEHTNLWRQERHEELQKTLTTAAFIGNIFAALGNGGAGLFSAFDFASEVLSTTGTILKATSDASNALAGLGTAVNITSATILSEMESAKLTKLDLGKDLSREEVLQALSEIKEVSTKKLPKSGGVIREIYREFPHANSKGGERIVKDFNLISKTLLRSSVTVAQAQLFSTTNGESFPIKRGQKLNDQNSFAAFKEIMGELGVRIEGKMPSFSSGQSAAGPTQRTPETQFIKYEARTVDFKRNDKHNGCVGFFTKGIMEITSDNKVSESNRGKSRIDDFLHSPSDAVEIIKGKKCNVNNGQSLQQATESYARKNR